MSAGPYSRPSSRFASSRSRVRLVDRGRVVQPDPTKPLTTDFRATLYLAHAEWELERAVDDRRHTPGLRRQARKEIVELARRRADEARALIGPAWAKCLEREKYAGVSLAALCSSLGLRQEYAATYRIASWGAHAIDATHFVSVHEGAKALRVKTRPEGRFVESFLTAMVGLQCKGLVFADDRLDLGLRRDLEAIAARVKELAGRHRAEEQ